MEKTESVGEREREGGKSKKVRETERHKKT